MPKAPLKVLFVDDEKENLEVFEFALADTWKIVTSRDPKEIFEKEFELWTFDAVFLDLVMPNKDFPAEYMPFGEAMVMKPNPAVGLQALTKLNNLWPHVKVFIHSALPYKNFKDELDRLFPEVEYLEKPIDFFKEGLLRRIEKLISEHQMKWKKEMERALGQFQ